MDGAEGNIFFRVSWGKVFLDLLAEDWIGTKYSFKYFRCLSKEEIHTVFGLSCQGRPNFTPHLSTLAASSLPSITQFLKTYPHWAFLWQGATMMEPARTL